ncbi:hypothetical protein COB72_00155 [bacterium]|nr:MAG: hypothetical protein COB72_00155 [bacterium]
MFYEPVWEYEEHMLVSRPDTANYFICWKPKSVSGKSSRTRRKSTGTSDLGEAKRRLIAIVKEHEELHPMKRRPEDVMLLDVLVEYTEGMNRRIKHYYPASRTSLKHFTEFVRRSGINLVSDFGHDAQQSYIHWRQRTMLKQGYTASNGTLNRELGVMKAALRLAWKRGRLESYPHIELLQSPPPRDRFLRSHEVRRLIEACEYPHLHLFVMLALHTLQRPIAIFSLRVEQVDLDWNRIDFLPSGSMQSNKRRPVVPITPSLRPMLEQAMDESEGGFILEYQGHPVSTVKKSFRGACIRAGLDDVTPYTLRHTGATLMAASGVPLRQIAGMLGHTESRTTEIYAKHHPDYLMDAARSIEMLFGDSPSTIANTTRLALPSSI